MRKDIQVRMATIEDAARLLEIYIPYITDTAITFEYEVPSVKEFEARIEKVLEKFPYLVAVEQDRIVGYAYASSYKTRAAYQWSVETSIYMDLDYQGSGIGSILYRKLFELLQKQRVRNVYACVTLPNSKSEAIHKKFGFTLIGRFHNVGYKLNEWHDTGWFEKHLDLESDTPEQVIPMGDIGL